MKGVLSTLTLLTCLLASSAQAGPVATATPVLGSTYAKVNSDAGREPGPFYLLPSGGRFTATREPGHVTIRFSSEASSWTFDFAAPAGEELAIGVYDRAHQYPWQSPVLPGLDINGEVTCFSDLEDGSFAVLDLAFGDDGSLSRLAVDFDMTCLGGGAYISGVLRFNSEIGFAEPTPTRPPPTPTPSRYTSAFYIESDPLDYLGEGQTKLLTPADGVFSAIHEIGFVAVQYDGGAFQSWDLVFAAPRGSELVPGEYDATNAPSPRQAGMNVEGEHRFCAFVKGHFSVREAAYRDGEVERLAIDFELRCENHDPLFFGVLRLNSEVPPPSSRTPTPTPRHDRIVLDIYSQSGDFVGSGAPGRVSSEEGSAQYYLFPWSDLRPHANFQVRTWNLTFASPLCGDLLPGTYEGATQIPWEEATAPGLDVTYADGLRSCSGLDGRFVIHEAHIGEDGEIYRFVADFEQRCHGAVGSLLGSFSYTSLRPTPTPAPPTPTPSDYSSVAVLRSDLGDFIGHCRPQYLTLAEGDFSAAHEAGVVTILFEGGPNSWLFQFAAPRGNEILPGIYPGATDYPVQREGRPGLAVYGQGRACDRVLGTFTVYEAQFGELGEVIRFAADFEQHCGGIEAALHGTVRYHSSLPPLGAGGNTPTPTATVAPVSAHLLDSLGAGDLEIHLDDASRFADFGVVRIDGEWLSYTGKVGNTLTGVRRGLFGAAPTSHPAASIAVSASVEGTIRGLFGHRASETGTDWNRDESLSAADLPCLVGGGACQVP